MFLRNLLLLLLVATPLTAAAASVPVLSVEGAIGPAQAEYIQTELDRAAERGAPAVVMRLDTPGGLDVAMRDIIQAILASPVPVIGWVGPSGARAASAGTYILYATHVAAMAPGTNLGAATPVRIGGSPGAPEPAPESPDEVDGTAERPERSGTGDAMSRKMVNDATAYIRSLAQLRGRNADWAEKAVREAASLSASEAAAENVVDFLAADLASLLAGADGRKVALGGDSRVLELAKASPEERPPNWRIRLLAAITSPNVAYILMLIGVYGLIFELANPGALVPGVLGGIALLLALFAFQALPINYAGLALILLGIGFMVAEAFVPSFGALGLGGVIAFATGSLMLFDHPDAAGFRLSLGLVIGVTAVSLVLFLGTAMLALRARRRPSVAGRDDMIRADGVVIEPFRDGQGRVRVHGESWRARCEVPLTVGDPVRVTDMDGLLLTVMPLEPRESGQENAISPR